MQNNQKELVRKAKEARERAQKAAKDKGYCKMCPPWTKDKAYIVGKGWVCHLHKKTVAPEL